MTPSPNFAALAFQPFRGDDPLLAALGEVRMARSDEGLVLRLDCGPRARNPGGVIHGGTFATLFDVAFYEATRTGTEPPAVTSALELKFLRPGRPELPLHVEVRVLQAGRSTVFLVGSAWQEGRQIAFASGQFTRIAMRAATGPALSTPDRGTLHDRPDH
ncbi:PaaI family thioesterase [Tabrizicola sp.]|uniref:PaaI family thioesterase n=1 Tax=Tabrizicola sp. TaxID=2005166 RepID=UPI0035B00943